MFCCFIIVPLVQSLSFFQSVLHSGEQLINNYKALMSPFHIKLFCVYNKSFCVFLILFSSFALLFHIYTHTCWIWIFNSVSINFYFCQLFILFDYQLSTQNLVFFYILLFFSSFAHFNTLFHFIIHLMLWLFFLHSIISFNYFHHIHINMFKYSQAAIPFELFYSFIKLSSSMHLFCNLVSYPWR